MSGRDPEPIAAFFPSIDRKLMRDLGRQLRGKAHDGPEPAEDPADAMSEPPSTPSALQHPAGLQVPRPSTADILGAVEQAANAMTEMAQRIAELEARTVDLEAMNAQLKDKLGEVLQLRQSAEATARNERERADRAEQIAAHHLTRSEALEADLASALGDLTRVADAITGTLGAGYRRA